MTSSNFFYPESPSLNQLESWHHYVNCNMFYKTLVLLMLFASDIHCQNNEDIQNILGRLDTGTHETKYYKINLTNLKKYISLFCKETGRNWKLCNFSKYLLLDGGTNIYLSIKLIFGICTLFVVIFNNLYSAFRFKRVDTFWTRLMGIHRIYLVNLLAPLHN